MPTGVGESDLNRIDFLGKNFLDQTKSVVLNAKEAERKAKQSEKNAIRAKLKTQELMSRIIPREIVTQFNNGVSIQPQIYDNVSIYMSSVVGYDAIVSNVDALQVFIFVHSASDPENFCDTSYPIYQKSNMLP